MIFGAQSPGFMGFSPGPGVCSYKPITHLKKGFFNFTVKKKERTGRVREEKYLRTINHVLCYMKQTLRSLLPTSRQSCNNYPSTTSACTISQNSLSAPLQSLHKQQNNQLVIFQAIYRNKNGR